MSCFKRIPTVKQDCIAYIPSQIQPLHVQELVTGSGKSILMVKYCNCELYLTSYGRLGAPCGSCNLNKDLRKALPNLLSDVLHAIVNDMDVTQSEFYDLVLKDFEMKKREYKCFLPTDGDMILDIPGIKMRDARNVILRKNQMIIKK